MPSRLGAVAGRYLLTRLLGEDAAVATYEGLDGVQDQPVLIKLLSKALTADPDRQDRLQNLMGRLAALNHPNLLPVITAGLEEGIPYLIAEAIAATPLAEKMGQPLDVDQVARIVTQAGEALSYAYGQGLIHGNLSPRTVLLTAGDHVLVSELGLESVLETPWEKIRGAPSPYLAPERIRGWQADARSDVYALGVMVFEMLTGLQLDGPADKALPWLAEIAPELAPDLIPVLARALSADPQVRHATVDEFTIALKAIFAPYLTAQPTPFTPSEPPTSSPVPEPPVAGIGPALESIPAIPMPQPPPMPSFDWDSFAMSLTLLPMPDPPPPLELPPMPQIEMTEPPTPTPPTVLPQASSKRALQPTQPPSRPQERSMPRAQIQPDQPARAVRRATPTAPAQRPPTQPPPPKPTLPIDLQRLEFSRVMRVILLVAAILFALTVCCCLALLNSDLQNQGNLSGMAPTPLLITFFAA
ncbi:MAG: serine/threonine-protein kinase [Chloroflexota bacterium]